MIADYLRIGREHARTGRDLAKVLNRNIRDITAGIEKERRQGQPIIASYDPEHPGSYLAGTAEELQQYCGSLNRRAHELDITRRALLATAENLPEQEG